jgi:hypothetical protein
LRQNAGQTEAEIAALWPRIAAGFEVQYAALERQARLLGNLQAAATRPAATVDDTDVMMREMRALVQEHLGQTRVAAGRTPGVFHPEKTRRRRGPLRACSFYTRDDFRETLAWRSLGDVLAALAQPAEPENPFPGPISGKTYLIPRGAGLPRLSDGKRFGRNPALLRRKQQFTEAFVAEQEGLPIAGCVFVLHNREGKNVRKVYALAYDDYLHARYRQFVEETRRPAL